MIIKIFQALYGDAISIKFIGNDEKFHNIFIDGGFALTYPRTVRAETLDIINRKECIDSFIITHIDQDHISGSISFIKDFCEKSIVKEFWFNTNLLINYSDSELISYNQAISARDLLISKGQNIKSIDTSKKTVNICGADFTFLSPFKEDLSTFQNQWEKHENNLISSSGCDYKLSISELSKRKFTEDTKIENLVSISFIFEFNNLKFLFLADSQPTTIINQLSKIGYSKSNKLQLDYMKISHHASKGNTSYELLEIIDCKNYIISADGRNRYNLPHKEALSRIIHHNKQISNDIVFIFNYNNQELKNIFTEEEKSEYNNFTCLYPQEDKNAFIIEL